MMRGGNGCDCVTGATVTSLIDLTSTIPDLPTVGATPHTTICARGDGCGVTTGVNSTFVTPDPHPATRAMLLASYTASVMARVNEAGRLQYLFNYTIDDAGEPSTDNLLLSIRVSSAGFLQHRHEYDGGIDQTLTSVVKPMLGVWYLFTVRMTITGAVTVCELLMDGSVVATSGSLVTANGGENCKLQIADGVADTAFQLNGGFAFADLSVGLRSDTYLKNLRGFGREWGIDGSTFARIVPDV